MKMYSATAKKNREDWFNSFIVSVIIAVAILSTITLASTIPMISVKPVTPTSTDSGNPGTVTQSSPPPSINPTPPAVTPTSVNPVTPSATNSSPVLTRPTTVFSHNWVGYAITGDPGSVSDAKGSWVIPSVTCASGPDNYAAFWVGIDGFNSRTVEQIGTDSDCVSGVPQYYAWFEVYPDFPYGVPVNVAPGDKISADVSYLGGSSFVLSISDLTTGQSYQTNVRANAQRSSAEWIAEAPYGGTILPLADFSRAYFGYGNGGNSVTMNGVTSPFGTVDSLYRIVMFDSSGNALAQPSPISGDGSMFSVMQLAN
jgi:hypothetical protein